MHKDGPTGRCVFRFCHPDWAEQGIRVVPSVSWGAADTFAYYFAGVEPGGTVAVSTLTSQAHGNYSDQKAYFMAGYNAMLEALRTERILCFCEPFAEMEGNIIPVDYRVGSWRALGKPEGKGLSAYADYICGTVHGYPPFSRGVLIARHIFRPPPV